MNGSFYEAEGDSSASFINVDDADFQIVAYLADIARFLVVVIGHFVDVEQAGQSVFEFNDYAEFKDLNDFSVYYIIDLMIMYSGFPWVREAVFVCEGDSLFFTIEGFDLDINDLIWFENVFYFANLLPGNIGDVEQSFHAVDSDECAVWHDLLNGALQNGAVLVSFFDFVLSVFLWSSSTALRERTSLFFVRSTSRILAGNFCPTRPCRECTKRRSPWDSGMKPRRDLI